MVRDAAGPKRCSGDRDCCKFLLVAQKETQITILAQLTLK